MSRDIDERDGLQTRPTECKPEAWFGGSRITHDDGSPLVLLHGTTTLEDHCRASAPFETFDRKRLGSVSGSSDAKVGFWFTSSAERAQQAATDATEAAAAEEAEWRSDPRGRNTFENYIFEVHLRVENPLIVDALRGRKPMSVARLAARAKAAGHDGLVFVQGENGGSDYLVFEPDQIRIVPQGSWESQQEVRSDTTRTCPRSRA